MLKSVLIEACKISAVGVGIGIGLVAADAKTGHIQTISEDTAKALCGKAWDGEGCILTHEKHDHQVTCYSDGKCSNVVVPYRTVPTAGRRPPITSFGSSKFPSATVQVPRGTVNTFVGITPNGGSMQSVTTGRKR
jgi:hypothetical protein